MLANYAQKRLQRYKKKLKLTTSLRKEIRILTKFC